MGGGNLRWDFPRNSLGIPGNSPLPKETEEFPRLPFLQILGIRRNDSKIPRGTPRGIPAGFDAFSHD